MTPLRVIVDQLIAPVPGGIGRYAEELTRQLIRTAPPGSTVEGIVSASPQSDYDAIAERLPGLARLHRTRLERRALALAWQHGFANPPGTGNVHATSMLAPLHRLGRRSRGMASTAMTIHDVVPWTHPQTLSARGVRWHRAMAARAYKYADAVVVPTRTVAGQLNEIFPFGDRVRVIGGAASSALELPVDAGSRSEALGLPERFILTVGTLEPRKGLEPLIRALALPPTGDVPLLIVGPGGWGNVDVASIARDAGLHEGRVRALGYLSNSDLAVTLFKAAAFVYPSLAEGFGLPIVEAFSLGAPVIHSDAPALVEVSAGAGLTVPRDEPEGYPERLAEAIGRLLENEALAQRLSQLGLNRAGAFSWRDSAEKVWRLHAEL